MTEPQRLSKRLTQLFDCSRREAELLIEGGWVMVDGKVVEEPQFKVLEQTITLHPDAVAEPLEPITMLWHKPLGVPVNPQTLLEAVSLTTRADDDHSRIRPLKKHFSHLKPLLLLEPDACGLQVLTQDYRVQRALGEEARSVEQEWVVEVSDELVPDGLMQLNASGIKVSWQNETRLRVAMKNPQPGQISRMCNAVGLTVLGQKRIRVGRVSMSALPAGQWRYHLSYQRF